jgi:hypothetical protein
MDRSERRPTPAAAALVLLTLVACGGQSDSTPKPAGGDAGARGAARTRFPGDIQVVQGNPDSTGAFVIRIRQLAGSIVPPHSYATAESITVVKGTWYYGTGAAYDTAQLQPLPVGTSVVAPAGTTTFAMAPEPTIVEIRGTGPHAIQWHDGFDTFDAPGRTLFKIRRDDRVTTLRGEGVVREGYGSGAVIQYEIEANDGSRFMSPESETRRTGRS